MLMRIDALVIVASFFRLGGILGGGLGQGLEQGLIDPSQRDFARLGAQIEHQWQQCINVCPYSRLRMRLSTFQELVVSNAALIGFGKIVALPPSTSRLAQQSRVLRTQFGCKVSTTARFAAQRAQLA
jgi:hypothetical protein